MKKANELIAPLEKHVAKANKRIAQKANPESAGPVESITPPVLQMSLWADDQRSLPNEIVRSALFNARNRKQKREHLKDADIVVIGDGRITYRGEELRQDDETVWLQLIHMVKGMPADSAIEFTPYSFCKAIGWPVKGQSYKRLVECLSRMQATSLKVYSSRLGEGISLSMIPEFTWKDDATDKALPKYRVIMHPKLVALFGNVHYTRLEWEQRLRLPVGVATWLHGYYASHKKPHPIRFETLAEGAGITTSDSYRLREIIGKALDELKAVGFLKDWQIVGELVHVERNPDY